MSINFSVVRWKNFLATGNNFIEIPLNAHPTTLIVGRNGSGKSTLLDAITFALFGHPFRDINKPLLISSINNGDCLTEIEFKIGSKEYKIRRGMKPTVFEIYRNGELIPQEAKSLDYQNYLEKSILKMNFKSFSQIVILGASSFVPFMQLKAADRRDIVEDLLDIKIFSAMNLVLKDRQTILKSELFDLRNEMKRIDTVILHTEKKIHDVNTNTETMISDNDAEIIKATDKITKLTTDMALIQKHIDAMMEGTKHEGRLLEHKDRLKQVRYRITTKKTRKTNDIKFFTENTECPTCTQELSQTVRDEKIRVAKTSIADCDRALAEVDDMLVKNDDEIKTLTVLLQKISDHNKELVRYSTSIEETSRYIDALQKRNIELRKNPDTMIEDQKLLVDTREDKEETQKKIDLCINEKHYYDMAGLLLKDTGIKTKTIKKYLPIMNKTINTYLAEMDSTINFTLDENFEESILSRYRDKFTYHSFSQGEKMKINLALLFTWRHIAKMKNSVTTNLLLFDEVFDSSLDQTGTDDFMKIINGLTKTNIFLISHKGDLVADKFSHVLEFSKVNDFTRVK